MWEIISIRPRVFKTLEDDRSAMRTMAVLLADIIAEGYAYARKNSDDFTWEGFHVYVLDGAGKKSAWHYECASEKQALEKKDELLGKYPAVIIRSNSTRRETTYGDMPPHTGERRTNTHYGNGEGRKPVPFSSLRQAEARMKFSFYRYRRKILLTEKIIMNPRMVTFHGVGKV